ncbi:ribosome assembly protein 4 [Angomonas deanei]|uniref:NLE (NUC135) domain/WD domain, G-beta repeat, putative n=1 Tax=Angomonas deanei TaxID=59799 RepID=A0A7G2CIW2_9TRYP|nr:ribosome assembly protein 4 [Angomonas deanei]CAD2219716.1 NLE (NUC135) domain/WD domain, G-beta repeat, putative [Angomonas deanei]|eukprot:EPY35510.1 ribosome assembly protein 4 [Angomonas deanei]
MPLRKRQRREVVHTATEEEEMQDDQKVLVRLVDENGQPTGSQILLPVGATPKQLDEILCSMFEDEELRTIPYAFFINGNQVNESVKDNLFAQQKEDFINKMLKEGRRVRPQDVERLEFEPPEETVVSIMFKPQAVFRVRPVTRCAGTLDGHSEAVLVVSFSPDSQVLATGGGDKEIRIWDMATLCPNQELTQHSSWVQVLAWSPDGKYLVSGSKDGIIIIWTHDGEYANFKGKKHKAHNNYVSHVSFEPLHKNPKCDRFVSASKDASLKVWSTTGSIQFSLTGHQSCVTCVKWGGEDRIYSSSQDRTVIVWDAITGAQRCVLKGHAHWVNFLALSTDLAIRTGAFDHEERKFSSREEMCEHAKSRYEAVVARFGNSERLVSGSDDNTMFLWNPKETVKSIGRMTGHQGAIFHIQFSPDGTMIASCSADKSVKLWNANDGSFITTFRGHVAPVYHVSWSLDSRMLVSGSRDATVKLWSIPRGVDRGLTRSFG